MALTSQIRSSEATFKLAQRLVESLSERFTLNKDDAWNHVSSMPIEVINRKMRKERRKRNPASQVKKPRTAFSFFTAIRRPVIQANNPNATFGELSRLVSNEWKELTATQLKEYKNFETDDRIRYNTELAAAKEKASAEGADVSSAPVADAKPVKAPRAKNPKPAAATSAVAPTVATPDVSDAKVAKSPKAKAPRAPKAAATPAATPVATPAATSAATPVATPVATPAAATPVGKKVKTPKA